MPKLECGSQLWTLNSKNRLSAVQPFIMGLCSASFLMICYRVPYFQKRQTVAQTSKGRVILSSPTPSILELSVSMLRLGYHVSERTGRVFLGHDMAQDESGFVLSSTISKLKPCFRSSLAKWTISSFSFVAKRRRCNSGQAIRNMLVGT